MTPHLSGLSTGTLYDLHARGKHYSTIYVISMSIESLVNAYQMIIFPRLHTNNCLPKILQIFQGSRHRRMHSRHTCLTWDTSRIPSPREAPNRCLDRIDARIVSRDTDGSSYVCPNTNPWTSISKESSLSACWSARRMCLLVGVQCSSENVIGGFEGKQGDRNIGLDKRNSTGVAKEADKRRIFLSRPSDPRRISNAAVISLNRDSLQYCYQQTAQSRSNNLTSLRLTGTPAKGPSLLQSWALHLAEVIRISVKQLVSTWALMALHMYVERTSIGFKCPDWTSAASCATDLLRRIKSSFEMGLSMSG